MTGAAALAAPLYDVALDPAANEGGPRTALGFLPTSARPAPVPGGRTLAGLPVGSGIGVPACPLTADAGWISALAGAGFDVLTHKTLRSRARPAHPFPQWLLGAARPTAAGLTLTPGTGEPISSANSFGVPSPEPSVWQADLESCLRVLGPAQLLIASVMGSPEVYAGPDLVADFVRVALLAAETGVRVVELNLSCPNTLHPDASGTNAPLCADPAAVGAVVDAVRAALPTGVALVAKLSTLESPVLREVLERLAPAVAGVAGINAVQQVVVDVAGRPAFGAARARAGVSGAAVRQQGLDFVAETAAARAALGATFAILGMGGVRSAADVRDFRAAGADIVQSATGTCTHRLLPDEIMELA